MTRINTGKVVAGGLLAGLLFNIGDFLINGYLLTAEYQATLTRLGLDAAAMESVGAMVCWVVIDFVFGLLIVWNYAAIRPRFGPGPPDRTAGRPAAVRRGHLDRVRLREHGDLHDGHRHERRHLFRGEHGHREHRGRLALLRSVAPTARRH